VTPDFDTNDMSEICGAIHIHSTYSDGETTVPGIIAAAKAVGLDYIVITDHMRLDAKIDGYEGNHDGVWVVVGYEHNDSDNKNHYLALGTEQVVAEQKNQQKYIDDIRKAGGVGFLAHPSEYRHYFRRYPAYPWTMWQVNGYNGIELWNQMSEWVENLKGWQSYSRILFPRRFLKGVPTDLMKRWDKLNETRFVSGIGGIDAHSYRFKIGFLTKRIFPIKVELKGIRTHILLKQPLPAADQTNALKNIINGLSNGNGYFSNYRRGDAKGARIYAWDNLNQCHLPGRNPTTIQLPASIEVTLPATADVFLMHHGSVARRESGKHISFKIKEKGIYRIEVRRRDQAWIYSNPFPIGWIYPTTL
jgi:hypothetical protein